MIRARIGGLGIATMLAIGIAIAAPASAQLTQGEARREASVRFNEGMRLLRTRAWAGALTEFEAAYRLLPDYRVLPLIAECHEGLRHSAEAAQALERYLREGGSALSGRERHTAELSLERLLPQVHALTVRTPLDQVEVLVDDRVVGTAPMPYRLFVTPGPHRVQGRKPGHRGDFVEVNATAGGTSTIELPIRALRGVATIDVTSDPAGLAVEVGGREVGRTPVHAEVPAGDSLVVVRRPGYPAQERRLTLDPESTEAVAFSFAGQPAPARLHFVSKRPHTRVSVDGSEWNEIDRGGEDVHVAAGRHAVRVEGEGDEAVERAVTAESGDRFLLTASRGQHRPGLPARIRWGAAAISAAVLLGAGLTGFLALSEESTFDSNAERIEARDFSSQEELARLQSDARDAKSSGETLATVSDVLWIAGGIAAIGTGAMFLFGMPSDEAPTLEVREEPAR